MERLCGESYPEAKAKAPVQDTVTQLPDKLLYLIHPSEPISGNVVKCLYNYWLIHMICKTYLYIVRTFTYIITLKSFYDVATQGRSISLPFLCGSTSGDLPL